MDMSFMTIFDIAILVLGAYLLFIGIKCFLNKTVDSMIVTAEELAKCANVEGLSRYLMPKTAIFGGFCIIFGIQGLLNDSGKFKFPQPVNVAFLVAFLVVWLAFSFAIRNAKRQYIR